MATVEEKLARYRQLYLELKPLQAELDALKEDIKFDVLMLGSSVKTNDAEASYRSAYTRTSWDGKRLDGYAAAHPEILAFRKESTVAATVSIKVK